jgi:hypothetical protein
LATIHSLRLLWLLLLPQAPALPPLLQLLLWLRRQRLLQCHGLHLEHRLLGVVLPCLHLFLSRSCCFGPVCSLLCSFFGHVGSCCQSEQGVQAWALPLQDVLCNGTGGKQQETP